MDLEHIWIALNLQSYVCVCVCGETTTHLEHIKDGGIV